MRTRSRTFALATAMLLVLTGIASVYLLPLVLQPNHYANVVSIEGGDAFRNPALIFEAWQQPVAASYQRRSYTFQQNQSFCGPASLVNVLRSIGMTTTQDKVLEGTDRDPWFGILVGGLTLDQMTELTARRTGHPVRTLRNLSLSAFRAKIAAVNDPRRRYIANFHRGPLFGRGHGHFSPLLAYLPAQDLILVGDVNTAYKPFLVRSERLWRAIDTIDDATGHKRGLIVVDLESR